jgi:hypothetical protein
MSVVTQSSSSMQGRMTAAQINAMRQDPRQFSLNSSGSNAPIPIVYGRRVVPGVRVTTVEFGGELYCLVVWCLGEVHSIEQVFINGADPVSGVELRHYRGTQYQGVDAWLAAAIPGYSDDLVLRKPGGDVGVCYTVARIPAAYDQQPRFQAIINGKLVFDPGSTSTGDPFYSDVALAVHFTGTDGQTSATDTSPSPRTLTFNGAAQILGNQLDAGGAGGGVMVADSPAIEFTDEKWSVEIDCETSSGAGFAALIFKSSTTSSGRGFYLLRSVRDLLFSGSSNGTTYNIMDTVVVAPDCFVLGVNLKILVEFTGSEYVFSIDGVETYRHASSLTIFDNSQNLYIGITNAGTGQWSGSIRCVRMTVGNLRYGAPVTNPDFPFYDNSHYSAGFAYSTNTALIFADVASSPLYGAGSTVTGLDVCRDWDNSDISPAISRSQIGIVIASPQKTEQTLDLLATYGEFRYIYEGSSIHMLPDKVIGLDNPSGPELVGTGDPETLDQSVATDAGGLFVITLTLTSMVAGSVIVDFDGVTVIDSETAAGVYAVPATATAAVASVEVFTSIDFDGVVGSVSVKRLHALHEKWVAAPPSMTGIDSDEAPTKVTINYTIPSDDSPDWSEGSVSYTLPEAAAGLVPLVETVITLSNIYRTAEAAYKAKARVLRMVNRVQVSGVLPDSGLSVVPGMVIQARRAALGIDILMLVDSWEMVEYGRYRVSGLRYDPSHYPSEIPLPENTTTVPVGAILPLAPLSSVPDGWEVFDAADGKYILGADAADSDYFVGETGGAATHAGFTGNTLDGGVHNGIGKGRIFVESLSIPGSDAGWRYTQDIVGAAEHHHTYNTGTLTPDIARRENTLIRKTGSPGALVPSAAMAFGFNLSHANLSRSTSFQNRLLMAEANGADAGVNSQWVPGMSGSTNDAHDHHNRTWITNGTINGPSAVKRSSVVASGAHTHGLLIALTSLPKKYTVALYSGTDDYPVIPGMVFLWDGSLVTLPTDFYLLDGSGGRADLRKHFIEIAGMGLEGVASGNNTIKAEAYSYGAAPHSHGSGSNTATTKNVDYLWHADSVKHNHNNSDGFAFEVSGDYVPPYYVLAAIVYQP